MLIMSKIVASAYNVYVYGGIFMKEYYIVLSSVTVAQRLQRALTEGGIRTTMVHTPKSISEGGCGYSLTVKEKDLGRALRIAEINAVKIRKTVLK